MRRSEYSDAVEEPSHYHGEIEPIDYMRSRLKHLPLHGFAAGCWMNTVKYLSRLGLKGSSLEDAKKARKYLDWLIGELS